MVGVKACFRLLGKAASRTALVGAIALTAGVPYETAAAASPALRPASRQTLAESAPATRSAGVLAPPAHALSRAAEPLAQSTGSSPRAPTQPTAKSAHDLVVRLLEARRAGHVRLIRQLTTTRFQKEHGDVWLDGRPEAPYFFGYTVKSSTVAGTTATVTVLERWNSGPETATYTVILVGTSPLVDGWISQ